MTINETQNDTTMIFQIEGRLDTNTAPQLEARIRDSLQTCKKLILDLHAVEYISSSGLRVVLLAHKLLEGIGGKMSVKNPSEFCKQVLAATGMESVLSVIS